MKKLVLVSGLCAVALITGCNKEAAEPVKKEVTLTTDEQKVSYIIGQNFGTSVKRDGFDVDVDSFVLGLNEAKEGKEGRFSAEDSQKIMMEFQQKMQAKIQAEQEAAASENIAKGEAFLAENAKKEGVVVTESGLQYKELVAGEGQTPKATDTVVVHYSGTLLDGTEFDSSYKRGEPAEFPVGNLIPGWVEALQLMNEGDEWELYIPSDLAYGPGGSAAIPANSTLIFKMKLIEIKDESASADPHAGHDHGADHSEEKPAAE